MIRQNHAKGKRKLNLWSESRMKERLNSINVQFKGLRRIAHAWNVPKSTIERRVKLVKGYRHLLGKSTVFNKGQENELCITIKTMAVRGFPITKLKTQELAITSLQDSCRGLLS